MSIYTSTIAAYATQAVCVARERGLNVEINAPFLKLRRKRSCASLILHLGHIVLEYLEVEPRDRRKHYGSAMLDDVIAIGEALGLRIDLIAESAAHPGGPGPIQGEQQAQPGLIQSKLESWYRRRKFVRADDALMRRVPTGTVRTLTPTG